MTKIRRFLLVTPFVAGAALALTAAKIHAGNVPPGPGVDRAREDRFEVHEWGTFTSFEGADGVAVEGLQHETEPLPGFVHARYAATASPWAYYGDRSRNAPVRNVRGKMETPVIYFHTRKPMTVDVHVSFQGLLTQWYPAASAADPPFPEAPGASALDASRWSQLAWSVDLSQDAPAEMPRVQHDADWDKARQVRAAYVRTHGYGDAAGRSEADQYIFYRGLGAFSPTVRVVASHGTAQITNTAPQPVAAAFLLEMKNGRGRFVRVADLGAGKTWSAALGEQWLLPSAVVVADLERQMQAALVRTGLFEDEARAMVRTWSPTWFAGEGSRVLYLVPREVTDAVLPMTISPTPDALVRTMVGRVDFMSAEQEEEVSRRLRDRLVPAKAEENNRELARLGRFLEPAMRSIAARSRDPLVVASALDVVAENAVR
jgi:hypothetical protein